MSIAINNNFERDQLVATFTGQVQFFYSFPIYSELYLTVYQYSFGTMPDDLSQVLTLGVDYTVSGVGQETGGFITLTVGATVGDIITIVGTQPIQRESVFQDLNPFTVALNQQLNQLTIMMQQNFTYWSNITPHYNFDELVSTPSGFNAGVRPFKLILPMLPDGHTWVGRGSLGTIPDDITTQFIGGAGTGNVMAAHPGMRPSIAIWTGTDFILTDSNLNIVGDFITPTAGTPANAQTGFDNAWGAMHWPAHPTANRPLVPANGDTYYDTTTNQFFGFVNGAWVPFGTGGNNAVIQTIMRANTFNVRNWVTVDDAGDYVLAKADTPAHDDAIGVVINATPTQFTIQQSGYNNTTFVGLDVTNHNYFLDTAVSGNMVNVDAMVNGQVSRPVFTADSATAGWVLPYRPLIVGGAGGGGGGGGGATTNPNVVTVAQNGHGFVIGDAIRAATPVGGQEHYVLAQANTFANSLAVGFVIQFINVNQFVYQTGGYILDTLAISGPLVDDMGAVLIPGIPYYLSAIAGVDARFGKITSVEPVSPNYSRPMYMPTQTLATTGSNAGVIWEERSLLVGATPPATPAIAQATSPNPFVTAAAGWVDTGICVNITTTTNTQKVLLMANVNLASDGSNGVAFRIARNGVPIDIGAASGAKTQASGGSFGQPAALDSGLDAAEFYLDSPAAIGSFTYCIQVNKGNSASVSVNAGITDGNSANFFRTASSIIAMLV